LDPIKIYGFAIITLVALLAALTWHLLVERKKQQIIKVNQNRLYIFIVFLVIVFTLLIMMEYYKGPQITLVDKEGYEISIKEQIEHVEANKYDGDDYYIDENKTFLFALPKTEGWSEPIIMNGLRAYIEKAGLETNKTNVESFLKWNPYRDLLKCIFVDLSVHPYLDMVQCLDRSLLNSPYGIMLKMSYSTVLEFGQPFEVEVKVNEGAPFNIFTKATSDSSASPDSAQASEIDTTEDEYTTLSYVNYFNITVLDKSAIPMDDDQLTLANYFLKNTINLSSNAEKLIANENNMLFTSSLEFKGARFMEWSRDIKIKRWVRMLEEPDKLYILEMAYSPDTDPKKVIWNDLKLIFESFALVNK